MNMEIKRYPRLKRGIVGGLDLTNIIGEDLCPPLISDNWTVGTGWASPSGTLVKNTAGTGLATLTTWSPEVGKKYKITVTIDSISGTLNLYFNGGKIYFDIFSGLSGFTSPGTYTFDVIATNTTGLYFLPSTTNRCVISEVCITEISLSDIHSDGGLIEVNNAPYVGNVMAGTGTRGTFLYYPLKNAFRVGIFNNSNAENSIIGIDSIAMGYNTLASGLRSLAIGEQSSSNGQSSGVLGSTSTINISSGSGNFILGSGGVMSGDLSSSLIAGTQNTISSSGGTSRFGCVAVGYSCNVSASQGSINFGSGNAIQNCDNSLALGINLFLGFFFGTYQNIIGIGNNLFISYNDVIGIGSDINGISNTPAIWITDNSDGGNVGIGMSNPTTISEKLEVSGNVFLNRDNDKALFGSGKDASIYYNGTNFVINPKLVGSGYLSILGNVGIGVASTAVLTLKAGTATAGTAPLKFTSGTLLTTPENGVIEYSSNTFYLRNDSISAGGYINGLKTGVYAYLTEPADTTITTANTYYAVAGTFNNDIAENFVPATTYTPGIKYEGTLTQYFEIDWHASVSADGANTTVHFAISKNGTLITGSEMEQFCKNADQLYNLSGTCVVSLAEGDEIQLIVTSDGDGDVLTVNHFTTTINEFFD